MKAVYFLGDRELEIREAPDPTPGPGEVVLENDEMTGALPGKLIRGPQAE